MYIESPLKKRHLNWFVNICIVTEPTSNLVNLYHLFKIVKTKNTLILLPFYRKKKLTIFKDLPNKGLKGL